MGGRFINFLLAGYLIGGSLPQIDESAELAKSIP